MLDLPKYSSIGEALRDALESFAPEVCLMESDRGEEKPVSPIAISGTGRFR
jgi:hypothetical protein